MNDFIIEDGVLKKYEGSDKEVIVPDECKAIGQMAFCRSEIVKVILPKGLQRIDMQSFANCSSLKEVILPETLQSIGARSFDGCVSLKEIILPDSINEIGNFAFSVCRSLEEIKLVQNGTHWGEGVFYGCLSLKKIIFPENIQTIEKREFENCRSLKELELPEGLRTIDDRAFMDCVSLTKLVIPESVRFISMMAFYNCKSLREVENRSKRSLMTGYLLRMESSSTSNNKMLPPVKAGFMPNENFDELKSDEKKIAVNCYLSSSGRYPEDKRESYESYIRKQSGKLLADYAQQGDIELLKKLLGYDYIKLPALQKAIDAAGKNNDVKFLLNEYLESHFSQEDLKKNKTQNQSPAPKKTSELDKLKKIWRYEKLDDGTLCITSYKGTDTDVTVPQFIGNNAVTEIGKEAFSKSQPRCINKSIRDGITNIVLPEGIVKIGERAFSACSQLRTISLPDSLRIIGDAAFMGCVRLEHVILPEGLLKLGTYAFDFCRSLRGLTIPSTVETIGFRILSDNSIITDVFILSKSAQFATLSFSDDSHAFSSPTLSPDLTIHGIKGSTAEEYANKYGFKFEELEK